jgi:serine protease AprX
MSRHPNTVKLKLSALAAGLLFSGMSLADARIPADLVKTLASASPTQELTVVVSYDHSGAITAAELSAMKSIGIDKGRTMRSLPIAGVLATPAEIQALARQPHVLSIFPNKALKYSNLESRQISGAARVVENQADFGKAIPYSGKGVAVVVNDSGVDGTHADLQYGPHLVQNTLGTTNAAAWDSMLPITYTEGVPQTDLGSGHGTHCAGIIGGTGAKSNGLYRGVAPGADLVGYGSGAVLLVLDAVGGLDYAQVNQNSFRSPVRVISNSWGSSGPFDPTDPVNVATYEAYKKGIVSVFAAGNDGPGEDTHNPYAQAPWVISVAAGEKNGRLTDFSSRGKRFETGTFTMPDGKSWTYYNEPTITATGVNVISTRDVAGALPPLAAQDDADMIDPAYLPYYTVMSGTSMATPHVAGIIALMLEANPNLTPAQVKDIIEKTATNMTGREAWEVGAGHINAYAAVAMGQGIRNDFGKTVNSLRTFNSNAMLKSGGSMDFSLFFSPAAVAPDEKSFTVGAGTSWITATADVPDNTVALVLTSPTGERYGSAISTPQLGERITTTAPATPGVWKLTVRGIGSISGVAVDPAKVTYGYGAPGYVDGKIDLLDSAGYSGLNDIANHPAKGAIQFAVSRRLVDGYSDNFFRPDQNIKRSELAQYLVMGVSTRQQMPLSKVPSFSDVPVGSALYPFAESAVSAGAPLRDLTQKQAGLMGTANGKFYPNDNVSRIVLAYAFVQALGLQNEAVAFNGPLTVNYNGTRIPVEDAAAIPANLRGYAQQALDSGVLNARFTLTQGPYDLQPTVHAYFDPAAWVTRAAYAVAAGRYAGVY